MSMDRCVEVSVVRWAQAAGGSVADEGLAEHVKDLWTTGGRLARSDLQEPLGTTTVLESPSSSRDSRSGEQGWPLAKPIDFERLGYLQHDLYRGGSSYRNARARPVGGHARGGVLEVNRVGSTSSPTFLLE